MDETNESWLHQLTSTGPVQGKALAELRTILLSHLRKAFQNRGGVDDPLLEDVAQEALIKTLSNLDQFQGTSRFTTWATSIAIRVALTELRRRHWKDVSLDQLLDDDARGGLHVADTNTGLQLKTEQNAVVEAMYRIIDTDLTDKQRTALLAELKGMPLEEIGRRLGSNRNAVYKLTHDARKRLKQAQYAAGFTAADLQPA